MILYRWVHSIQALRSINYSACQHSDNKSSFLSAFKINAYARMYVVCTYIHWHHWKVHLIIGMEYSMNRGGRYIKIALDQRLANIFWNATESGWKWYHSMTNVIFIEPTYYIYTYESLAKYVYSTCMHIYFHTWWGPREGEIEWGSWLSEKKTLFILQKIT